MTLSQAGTPPQWRVVDVASMGPVVEWPGDRWTIKEVDLTRWRDKAGILQKLGLWIAIQLNMFIFSQNNQLTS